MTTTTVAAATMKVAQISKPGTGKQNTGVRFLNSELQESESLSGIASIFSEFLDENRVGLQF